MSKRLAHLSQLPPHSLTDRAIQQGMTRATPTHSSGEPSIEFANSVNDED
jgi:hypothetical protein